jgi:hypothetical protein
MENTPDYASFSASSSLRQAATGLGAEVIAILQAAGSQVEITCFWSRFRARATRRRFIDTGGIPQGASGGGALISEAGSPLAKLLGESISAGSQSFLLFPSEGADDVTVVIGFAEPKPPVSEIPDVVLANLKLLGWAEWSAGEIARLRAELRIVNERLAGRKLVERAKGTLQAEQSISEEQAYEYLRGLSRKRRITLAELSAEILSGRSERNPARFALRQPEPTS